MKIVFALSTGAVMAFANTGSVFAAGPTSAADCEVLFEENDVNKDGCLDPKEADVYLLRMASQTKENSTGIIPKACSWMNVKRVLLTDI
jgi:hypothetical protein